MNNTFGTALTVSVFGESHGTSIGAVIDGMPSGIKIDKDKIDSDMAKRKSSVNISTARIEEDKVNIVSGVFNSRSTGTPICLIIDNNNTQSNDYELTKNLARPGHADYTAECRYDGYQDYRGGGHFSGRITAGIVAAGSIFKSMLEDKGIKIGTTIIRCGGIEGRPFDDIEKDIESIKFLSFPTLSNSEEMIKRIEKIKLDGDSAGGILQTAIIGLPAGVGEPWYDSFESMLSHAVFSVPAVKGIEFGAGFDLADMTGSQANDSFASENGNVFTLSNNNGGLNGGITNGMPVLFNTVIKPTPSIYKTQKTIDIKTKKDSTILIQGRHDPAIIHRAAAVLNAVTAHVCADMLCRRYGNNFWER